MRLLRTSFPLSSVLPPCLLLVLLAVKPAVADSVDEALSAAERGDKQTAIAILKSLARQGDNLARYNLGLFYKKGIGVSANTQLAEYWFEQAALAGVVNAHAQLSGPAVHPGKLSRARLVFGPGEWIRVQDPGKYTLQLASSRNIKLIQGYYSEYQLQGRGGYFLNRDNNRYALVFGAYSSVAEATAAIQALPEALRQWQPWVRPVRQIQARMRDG